MKLDSKDKAILYELDKNSRQTYTQIAKKTKLKKESVRYRIEKLKQENVINTFLTVFDSSKLGLAYYKVFFKLHNISSKTLTEIINKLKEEKNIIWIAEIEGDYHLGISIASISISILSETLNKINQELSKYINKQYFSINASGEFLNRDYLVGKRRRMIKEKQTYTSELNSISKIDDLNLQIMEELSRNSRESAVNIGHKINSSTDTAVNRIKQLEKSNIINRYNIALNNQNIQQIQYKTLLYIKNLSPKKVEDLISYCKQKNNIIYIIKTIGEWNLELDLEVENISQYREIMFEITEQFYDIIDDYKTLIIRKIHKYESLPRR